MKRKLSRLNDQQIELSPSSQLLEIRSNKNIFDEKMPLDNDIQQKSSLLNKGQKNNIYNNKIVHTIKESESEYKNEFNKQENEENDIKEENKDTARKKEKKGEKNTNLTQPKEKENNIKVKVKKFNQKLWIYANKNIKLEEK